MNRSTSLWINRSFRVDSTHTWGTFSCLGSSGVVAEEGLFHLYVHTCIRWVSPSAGERRGDPGPLCAAALTCREGWKDPLPDAVPLHGLAWPQHPVQPRRSADNDRGCTQLPQEDGHTHGRPLQVNVVAHPCGQKEKKKERQLKLKKLFGCVSWLQHVRRVNLQENVGQRWLGKISFASAALSSGSRHQSFLLVDRVFCW